MSRFTVPARAQAIIATAAISLTFLVVPAQAAQAAPATFTAKVVASMGDSITRAAVADGTRNDNSKYSWSAGTAATTESHVMRLGALQGWTPPAYNYALGGTTSDDLVRQADSVVSRGADYVTILSGANDVCRSETVADLPDPAAVAANFAAALEIINTGLPDARVFVASIPNMRKLHAAGITTVSAPLTWALLGVCPVAMADPLNFSAAAEERRASVERYIKTLNTVIAETCQRASLCFSDGGAVFDMPVKIANVSTLDYFHPSVHGQTELAAVTWAAAVEAGTFDAVKTPTTPTQPQPAPEPGTVVIDETSESITWTGDWATTRSSLDRGGSVAYLKSMSSSFSLTFTGTRVSLVVRTTPSAGVSEVSIDGIVVGHVDGYSSTVKYDQTLFTSKVLSNATHTITVVPTMDLAAASSGRNLVLDAILIDGIAK